MNGLQRSLFLTGCAGVALTCSGMSHAQSSQPTSIDPQSTQPITVEVQPATTGLQNAQTATPATDSTTPDATAQADDSQPAEIVVTANKREQNLNDVGLSVTAISGEVLAERRVTSV